MKYYAIAVNQKHPNFEWKRFGERFHVYNKFTSIALKGAFSWLFGNQIQINIKIYTDKKIDRPKNKLKELNRDNFHEYLEERIFEETVLESILGDTTYKGPLVNLQSPVLSLTFNNCYSSEFPPPPNLEYLQLCDLITSSIGEAIYPRSKVEAKKWFAKNIAQILLDIRKKPWNQDLNLHRIFGLSFFPDENGCFYPDEPLGIIEEELKDAQGRLF
jgi:hypothetical protein